MVERACKDIRKQQGQAGSDCDTEQESPKHSPGKSFKAPCNDIVDKTYLDGSGAAGEKRSPSLVNGAVVVLEDSGFTVGRTENAGNIQDILRDALFGCGRHDPAVRIADDNVAYFRVNQPDLFKRPQNGCRIAFTDGCFNCVCEQLRRGNDLLLLELGKNA